MSILENWQRLDKFWKELDFEKLQACNIEVRKKLDENLSHTQSDLDDLKDIIIDFSSIERKFISATKEEIKILQNRLGIKLPNSFKESLQINVGDVIDGEYIYPWLGGWNCMLNIDDMMKYSLDKTEYYCIQKQTISFQERINLPIEYAYWNKKWLVFYDCNGDEQYVLNLDDTSSNYGEVLSVDMEFSTIERLANSYEEWFDIATEETLKYGEILFLE